MYRNIRTVLYHGIISEISSVDVSAGKTDGKARTALGLSVVAVTKYLMEKYSIDHEEAYKKLTSTDFFELLDDLETGLYLEPDAYLCEACLLELEKGPEAMYEFIGRE